VSQTADVSAPGSGTNEAASRLTRTGGRASAHTEQAEVER
jgi:hypothetical protein